MRNLLFLLLFFNYTGLYSLAQETKTIRRDVLSSTYEKYEVLKSNKKIKHGTYRLYRDTLVLISGKYDQGKRVGNWYFFSTKGVLEQRYNYDTQKLTMNRVPEKVFNYAFPDSVKPGDTVAYPAILGGVNAMIILALKEVKVPEHVRRAGERFTSTHTFHLSPEGAVEKWEIRYAGPDGYDETFIQYPKVLENYEFNFVPAIVNSKKVSSKLTYNGFVSTYTIPTTTIRTSRGGIIK